MRLLRRRALGLAVAVALVAPGCLVQSHTPSSPLPLDGFCAAFFDALCEPMATCECAPAAVDACRAEQRELCARVPSAAMREAVEAGRLRYDGAAAARLVARMREREAGCEGFVDALDWRIRDLFSLGGVFQGTLEAGAPCTPLGFELIGECALGSCAPSPEGPVCRAAVGEGERCDATHQCVDLDAELTIDRGIDRLALRCVTEDPDAEAGTCAPFVAVGGACAGDAACWSGRCEEGRCVSRPLGASCLLSRECESGYCRRSDGTCQPGARAVGATCEHEAACATHVCVDGTCQPAACGTF